MSDVRVLLLRTAGTNCNRELAHAFGLVGAEVEELHINALLQEPGRLGEFQVLGFPGGFSYGDDIASGKILANQLIHHLKGPLKTFVDEGKLVLGVCNGFQVLVKAGLLPGPMGQLAAEDWHPTTLTYNTRGRFEDRWVRVKSVSRNCAWLPEGGCEFEVPIAHGEGRFVARDGAVMEALKANDQVAFAYTLDDRPGRWRRSIRSAAEWEPEESIAGICDVTGRVMGLMPHPERVVDAENHPLFSRGGVKRPGDWVVFESAMKYLQSAGRRRWRV